MKQLALKNRKLNAKIYALQVKIEKLERKCKTSKYKGGETFND